ncbi:hypothetical protein LTR10_021170 [Elasticomyces elasticus]|uniref:DNA replication regulator Sld3 C-terminal domain-containing protein n=1 Tax=Exophiala sideris TaxID=1016849 RepID=A0ABR0JNY2_9EURO|nr:hypothetical protein LTR10_021170 [Elasticomyces elasticus]KAK5038199.1 hypothetical protein LTS07_001668 [Exophiala sideris]KAK5044183.1 hypothetical protein LTR13_000539 [Exophiala sideris]KAK5067683.1 hypothetical protein LTR69_001672 [Exophiala sideris]KAK5184076.1 hypothetical protein LTR44_003582 [Eurotiomycetes sp. CCFEE 6388]
MSQGMIKRPQDTLKVSKSKEHSTKTIPQVNERLAHLWESILPRQPYLLSVPSDVPYRHSSRFINTWYEGTPFDEDEEQLQYLSFLPHLGEHESLLKVEGGWADEQGNRIQEEELSQRTVPASGRNTPADTGNRKKISLKDYKTKGKSPPVTTPRLQASQIAKEAQPAAVSEKKSSTNPNDAQAQEDKDTAQRKLNGRVSEHQLQVPVARLDGTRSPHDSPKGRQPGSPSPTKKRRLSPPFEDRKSISKSPLKNTQPPIMEMPRLLSPTLPSPEHENGLPQLLSPVLPPSLAKMMSSSPNPVSSPANGSHQRTDSVRSILAGADLDNDNLFDKNKLAPTGSRVRSDSQHSARSSAPGTPNGSKFVIGGKVLSKNGIKVGTPLQTAARASPGPQQRHTIILKYGKKNRKRVEGLLKFAPRPKKGLVTQDAISRDIKLKKELVKEEVDSLRTPDIKPRLIADEDVRTEKKRKAEDSPGPSSKKMKSSMVIAEKDKRPSTPVPSVKTPQTSMKSTFSTPKKDLKSTAMRRVESSEGVDVPTPGDKGRVSTPVAVPKPSPQPTSASSTREDERQLWTNIGSKFFALGRTLKHEGSSMLPPSEDDSKPEQSAKAVILLIEALLCFMINIAAQSHMRPGADPGWRSTILYHIFVYRASRKHPHLHGLVVQLGAVCRQAIHRFDLEKLARDALPEDYCNSAPTPGSDGNTRTNEDGTKYKKRYIEFKDELVHNALELQTAWLEGSRRLCGDLLRRDYPNTWAKRARDASARLQDKIVPTKIPKEFYLPMDANTTAFEAARFGVAFLEEWAEKEKIEWKTRIDL